MSVAGHLAVDDLDDPARVPHGQVRVVRDQDQRRPEAFRPSSSPIAFPFALSSAPVG